MRAGSAVYPLCIAQIGRGGRLLLQLRPRAEARIDQPFGLEPLQMELVDGRALALIDRRRIPPETEPAQVLDRLPGKAARAAGRVKILNAQQKPPARMARGQIGQQRAQQVAQVQPSAGRGGEAPGHVRVHPFTFVLFHVFGISIILNRAKEYNRTCAPGRQAENQYHVIQLFSSESS